MEIIFQKNFDLEIKQKKRISRNNIRDVISSPISSSTIKIDDLEIHIYLGKFSSVPQIRYLLICARFINGKEIIDEAYKLLPEIIENTLSTEPIVVLQEFASRFGFQIRIGNILNKFIYQEIIPFEPNSDNKDLFKLMVQSGEAFESSQYIKIVDDKNGRFVKCALMFCINLQKYNIWLSEAKELNLDSDPDLFSCEIAQPLKGYCTIRDILQSIGTIEININYSQLMQSQKGIFFRLVSRLYNFELGFENDLFYFERCNDRLELPFDSTVNQNGDISFYAMWNPNKLSMLILEKSVEGKKLNKNDFQVIQGIIDKKIVSKNTVTTTPPYSLINKIRKQDILPEVAYETENDFDLVVTSLLQSIEDKVKTIGLFHSFWNITYDGLKIINRLPKHEIEIHPLILGLLNDQALAKNLAITREYPIGGGNLDFLVTGQLKNYENVHACIEFKNAHSQDLEAGLAKQLPAYMRSKGCDYGLYGVLYFRGQYFNGPEEFKNINELVLHLENIRTKNGLVNIRILIIDVSNAISPSRLKI